MELWINPRISVLFFHNGKKEGHFYFKIYLLFKKKIIIKALILSNVYFIFCFTIIIISNYSKINNLFIKFKK